jgi:hypothetical protein
MSRVPLAALAALLLTLAAQAALAQESPAQEAERAKKAVAELKAYTDQFRSPGGDPFPAPPPIPLFSAKQADAPGFYDGYQFSVYKNCASDYRALFDWWEDAEFGDPHKDTACFAKSVHLDPERFQLAYGKASGGGADKEAGGRWVCGLVDSLRNYFNFYNELNGGQKGTLIAHSLWGVGVGPVEQMREVNGWISKRYKEASGIDLGQGDKNTLNYATKERCEQGVREELAKLEPEKKSGQTYIPSLMKKPEPRQEMLDSDLTDVDFDKYDYWVYYYDASWQPWGYVARTSKKWKPTPESFKKFVLCRAPEWVGNYVYRAPKNAKLELTYFPKGGVSMRHPLQPDKASLRDPKLIAEHRRKYCR